MLRSAVAFVALAVTVALGVSVGVAARSFVGMESVFALLVLSAAVVAIAQQTLP